MHWKAIIVAASAALPLMADAAPPPQQQGQRPNTYSIGRPSVNAPQVKANPFIRNAPPSGVGRDGFISPSPLQKQPGRDGFISPSPLMTQPGKDGFIGGKFN